MALLATSFQQEELADADLIIQAQPEGDAAPADLEPERDSAGCERASKRQKLEAMPAQLANVSPESNALSQQAGSAATELARFPAHRIVLYQSDYFRCQIQRWTEEASCSSSGRPAVALTLERPEQQAAATAVLGAMYGVRGALSELEHAQLVDAVLLADMLQVPGVVQQAVDALKAAASSEAGLSAAALAALGGMAAWPSCLVPLLQHLPLPLAVTGWCRIDTPGGDAAAVLAAPNASAMRLVLLSALGDLERVWADKQLKDQLLALPLPAMQLLLASDELQVTSEDTVLYTAACYVREQPPEQQAAARERLAVLVRAPQLSRFALSAAALSPDADSQLLGVHSAAVKQLAALLPLKPAAKKILRLVAAAPAAWSLGPRRITPLPAGVQLVWRLPVAELAAACRRCAGQRKTVRLNSPAHTPPLGGLAWQLEVQCRWRAQEGGGGCKAGVFCVPVDAPLGVFYKLDFSIRAGDVHKRKTSPTIKSESGWGWTDFFRVGVMRGGWDPAAWAAKGWPAQGGPVELRLTVRKVR